MNVKSGSWDDNKGGNWETP